jgi:hypothetical protein
MKDTEIPDWVQRVAFKVENMDVLMDAKDMLEKRR